MKNKEIFYLSFSIKQYKQLKKTRKVYCIKIYSFLTLCLERSNKIIMNNKSFCLFFVILQVFKNEWTTIMYEVEAKNELKLLHYIKLETLIPNEL